MSQKIKEWEVLNKTKIENYSIMLSPEEDVLLQQALAESMGLSLQWTDNKKDSDSKDEDDVELKKALELSEHEHRQQELYQKQEEEDLLLTLQLSLNDK